MPQFIIMGNNWSSFNDVISRDPNEIIDDIKRFIQNDELSFLDLVGDDSVFDDDEFKRRRYVRRQLNKDWWSTPWGLIILDPKILDIDTFEGKLFRRRFRIPGPFFLNYLVPECKRVNTFDS